ncbi:MAG: HEAT repeat domain-containing protein, partial [Planctomycetota bacterium]
EHPEALKELGASKWKAWARGNPLATREIRTLEYEFVTDEDDTQLALKWKSMKALGTSRKPAYLGRARRSAALPKGRHDKTPLTLRSKAVSGATYSIYVPTKYDPLTPTALVVGLHGGGRGGKDRTLVTGSGESAMNFYQFEAESWNWIVVCPSALAAPWGNKRNEVFIDALLDEMAMLYNIDESRIYLTGHSMGGFGTWQWAPRREEIWAACSPCAGGGSVSGGIGTKVPIYIYHGADDRIVGPSWDRAAAKTLLGKGRKVDFVYTELEGVGHGFPRWVSKDIFSFFAGRWKERRGKKSVEPRSSFDRKVGKEEIKTFGNPVALEDEEEDATLRDLIAALSKGGGGAAAAAEELGKREDAVALKKVSAILRSKKYATDARVYAAKALGMMGRPECVKPLSKAIKAEDFRIVEAVAWGLGKTKSPEAASPLAKTARRLGELYEKSFFGNMVNFTEYEVRLKSLTVLVTAFHEVGNADVAIPALQKEVVDRVFTPPKDYIVRGDKDPRFRNVSPMARLRLTLALKECLVSFKDKRGIKMLRSIAERWEKEGRLVREAQEGAEILEGEEG